MELDSEGETEGSETQVVGSQWGSTEVAGREPESCLQ